MDPDAALTNIREALKALRAVEDAEPEVALQALRAGHLDELLDHVEALDMWMSNGGFLPEDWRQKR